MSNKDRIIEFLEKNPTQAYPRRDLARALGMQPRQITRVCTHYDLEHMGYQTRVNYHNSERVIFGTPAALQEFRQALQDQPSQE